MKKYLFFKNSGLYDSNDITLDPTLELLYDTTTINQFKVKSSNLVKYNNEVYFEYNWKNPNEFQTTDTTYYVDKDDNVARLENGNYGQMVVANNNLFKINDTTIKRLVGTSWVALQVGVSNIKFYDIKYSNGNGKYYILANNRHIYITTDFLTYEDFDLSSILESNYSSIDVDNNNIYIITSKKLRIYDLSTLTIVTTVYDIPVTGQSATCVFTIKKGNYLYGLVISNKDAYYPSYFTVFRINIETLDYTDFVTETSLTYEYTYSLYSVAESYNNNNRYCWFTDNKATKKIIYSGTKGALVVDYSTDNFSVSPLFTLQEKIIVGSVYKELHPTFSGVGFSYTTNADNEENGVLYNDLGKNFQITISPLIHYAIDEITSVNGVVSGNTITYSSDDLYQEDTITVTTIPDYEYNGGLEITDLDGSNASALSEDFYATCVGYIIYNNIYLDIVHLICSDGNLSVEDSNGHEWSLFYNGEYVEEWSGILVGELHYLSNAFYNKISSFALAQYYRNVKFNEPTYDNERGTYSKWESSATKKIDMIGNYFVYSKTGINIQYTFLANDGYKVDSIISNYGTVSTNTLTITSLNDDAEINIQCNFVGATFQIVLCHLQDENDVFNKRTTNNLTVTGSLVENSSIINPTILFELSGCPTYNYCKISSFNRCYYITDVQNVGFNLWMISLEVDEIESFKTDIINYATGLVERSNYKYDSFIDDNLEPKKANLATSRSITLAPAILKADGTIDHLQTNLIDCKHYSSQSGQDVRVYYNIAVTLSNCDILTHSSQVYDDIDGIGDILQPLRVDYNDTSLKTFIFSDMLSFQSFMYTLNFRHKDSFVVSAYKFPFNLVKTISYYENNTTQRENSDGIINGHDAYQIKIGGDVLKYDTDTDYTFEARGSGARLVVDYVTAKYFHYADIKITNPSDYTDYNATYKLNIPYYGDIELSRETIFNANKEGNIISIYYCVDLQLGNCKVILVDKAHNNIILEQSVNMAIELPYNFDTSEETRNRIEMKRVNIATDSFRNIFNGIGSGMALNINGLGNSAFSLTEQHLNYKREMSLMYPTAYTNKFSGALANYTNKNIILTKIKKESNLDLTTKPIYADEKGIPCNKYTNNISTDFLLGFTGDLLFLKFSYVNIKSLIATNREIESIKSALMSGIKYRINNN